MLLIYLPKKTPRNRYCLKTIFKFFLKFPDYQLTTSIEEYLQHKGPKFSYANKPNESGVHFHAFGLLEQKGIDEQNVPIGEHQGLTTLFHHQQKTSALPYDPFSACFYMLSRYEEYLPHLEDKYNRFNSGESLAKKHNFLKVAVVERWILQIRDQLQATFPDLQFPKRKFHFIPTIDIDNAYAFKEKGFLRTVGSLFRSLFHLDFKVFFFQLKVLARNKKDPFDTYSYQLNIHKKYRLKPIYFFLLGDYGLNDKNLSHENKHFQRLIKTIADYAEVGIHPSFGSTKKARQLHVEIQRLSRIVKREVKKSRQHYLKLNLPESYRRLTEEDIQEDYTMGFADALGFRAGCCTPYPFYDLDEELELKLMIFPFQVMESTLKYYLNAKPEQSTLQIDEIIEEVKAVNGTFISLWHNESLSDQMEWEGWRVVYEKMIETAMTSENGKN